MRRSRSAARSNGGRSSLTARGVALHAHGVGGGAGPIDGAAQLQRRPAHVAIEGARRVEVAPLAVDAVPDRMGAGEVVPETGDDLEMTLRVEMTERLAEMRLRLGERGLVGAPVADLMMDVAEGVEGLGLRDGVSRGACELQRLLRPGDRIARGMAAVAWRARLRKARARVRSMSTLSSGIRGRGDAAEIARARCRARCATRVGPRARRAGARAASRSSSGWRHEGFLWRRRPGAEDHGDASWRSGDPVSETSDNGGPAGARSARPRPSRRRRRQLIAPSGPTDFALDEATIPVVEGRGSRNREDRVNAPGDDMMGTGREPLRAARLLDI